MLTTIQVRNYILEQTYIISLEEKQTKYSNIDVDKILQRVVRESPLFYSVCLEVLENEVSRCRVLLIQYHPLFIEV